MNVTFIFHGAKKQSAIVKRELTQLCPAEFQFTYCFTQQKCDATTIALKATENASLIVAVGGDGLLNECLNGLMQFREEHEHLPLPSLAIIPIGSGNDFARNFRWTGDTKNFIARLQSQQWITADIGCASTNRNGRFYFINEASLGLSTEVVRRVNAMPIAWSGNLKFGWAIMRTFLSYKKKEIALNIDRTSWQGKSMMTVIANGKYFGSGIGIAPSATIDDGWFDVTVIGNIGLVDYLIHLSKLKRCEKLNHRHVHYFKAKSVSLNNDGIMECDGELIPETVNKVELLPGRIKFLG